MVTTVTDAKRRQGKGEVRYDRGRARAHPTRGKMKLRRGRPNPCVAPSESSGAEEWVARSLINTAARFLLRLVVPRPVFLLLYIHL